jgi:hypothetical protein
MTDYNAIMRTVYQRWADHAKLYFHGKATMTPADVWAGRYDIPAVSEGTAPIIHYSSRVMHGVSEMIRARNPPEFRNLPDREARATYVGKRALDALKG